MPPTVISYDEINIFDSNFQALPTTIQKGIQKIIKKSNFKQYEVKTKDLSTSGDNFLGKLYEVDIKDLTPEGDEEINIFIKEKINLNKIKLLNSTELFANEELVYKELSKVMTSLQDQANIPAEDRFKIAKGYEETNNEAIILENLCKRGYKRFDKTESISLKFVELGVQELAKLHGISFVIEKKMPKYFNEKIAALGASYHFDDDWNELLQKVFKYTANLFDDKTKNKIERLTPTLLEKVPKYHTDRTTVCALCHGDYKKNNVMFRVNNGEPVELMIIDYQLIEYGSPIKDLILFLYFGSDREFRREHVNKLKELYFETLSRFLQYFDIDVETIFPRQKFEKTYREWLDYGLVMCLYFSVFLIPANSSMNLKDMNLKDCPFNPDEAVEKMIRELVEDFIEWGYLDA